MATTGRQRLLLVTVVALLAIAGLVYLRGQPTAGPAAPKPPAVSAAAPKPAGASSGAQSQPTATKGPAATKAPASAGASDLLAAIEKQAPAVVQQQDMAGEATRAAAVKIWIELDAVMQSWPQYKDVREELRKELGATMDLSGAPVGELRSEASRLQAAFWQQEGYRSARGYREAYKARLLLEIAHEREPDNLAVADELVDAIGTGNPLTRYDPETRDMQRNPQVIQELEALRTKAYAQTRREVEQGRAFTWADFARVADYTHLWSHHEPQKAAEAFEWALSHTSGTLMPGMQDELLARLGRGEWVSFSIYEKTRGKYPRDYLYARRLPSFRGPNPEARGLVPRWTVDTNRSAGK